MAGVAAVVLAVLGLLAAVHSQQETRFEDPTTEFYVRLLKTLIANSTKNLQGALTRLEDNSAKEETLTELQDSIRDVKDSVNSLESNFKKIRDSVDDGADRTRVEMRMLSNRMSKELGDLKRLVQDKSKEMTRQVLRRAHLYCYPDGTCLCPPVYVCSLIQQFNPQYLLIIYFFLSRCIHYSSDFQHANIIFISVC